MTLDPRTPVLVGAGAVDQHVDDPVDAREPFALMASAVERAAGTAGSHRLLEDADVIAVPRGFWQYSDPGRLVAARVGAALARTVLAEIGVLQQTLINDACREIAAGAADVVIVVGGDARHRSARARAARLHLSDTEQAGVDPDVVHRPEGALWAPLEADRGLVMPVTSYAVMENALRHADGQTLDAHRDEIATLWSAFSRVAAENPHAWHRRPVPAAEIRDSSPQNPMLAFPYTKLHNSRWTVDQAAALILCSVEKAHALGLAANRWVFPLAGTESNHMLPLSARADLHRCPAAAIAGRRALALAGVAAADLAYVDLYSCFPVAVRIQARELGLATDRPLTVTGGMAFAGGPLNNYVLQATVRMAEILQEDRGTVGLVSAVSGMLTKVGFGVWSTTPPADGFHFADVTEEAAAATPVRPLVAEHEGAATVAGYTVLFVDGAPVRIVAVCDLPDARRTVATSDDAGLAAAIAAEELCGRRVRIGPGGALAV